MRCCVGVVVAVLLAVVPAHAQGTSGVGDEFGIERFRLAMDRAGIVDVDSADVPGHLSWSAGLWVGFAHDPLVLYDQSMAPVDSLVGQRLTTGVVGSLGLIDRIELGLGFDIVGYQSGDTATTMTSLPSAGIGDLRLGAKVLMTRTEQLQFAVIPAFTVPVGDASGFLRESGPTFAPELAISGGAGRIRGAGNLGYRLRSRTSIAGLVIDDEVFARIGAGVRVGPERAPIVELSCSSSLALPTSNVNSNQVAIEILAGAARRVTPAVSVFAAGGLGLDNGFGTPDWRAVLGVRLESERGDRDGDRIEGLSDRCPDQAEDLDGFDDHDGCPDLDNDGDGVADAQDRCLNDAEDRDSFSDDDGCADPDNDGDGIPDAQDRCPNQPEDKDGIADADGCDDPSVALTGRVVSADGRPISGASLTIEQPEAVGASPIELTPGDDGSFTANVHGSSVTLTARAPEYQTSTQQAKVGAGQVEIKLSRTVRQGQLRGQVLSWNGKPLVATIQVLGSSPANATTDAEGRFVIELPAGTYEVVIESPGHAPQRRTVSVKLDGVTVLNADLRGAK